MSKYHSKRTIYDGIVFASAKEARRWQDLKLMEAAGEISGLDRQVKFLLIPAQREKTTGTYYRGKRRGQPKPGRVIEKECSYYADFVYTDRRSGEKVVEDTKGVRTEAYKIKRKLMLYVHGIRIKEV